MVGDGQRLLEEPHHLIALAQVLIDAAHFGNSVAQQHQVSKLTRNLDGILIGLQRLWVIFLTRIGAAQEDEQLGLVGLIAQRAPDFDALVKGLNGPIIFAQRGARNANILQRTGRPILFVDGQIVEISRIKMAERFRPFVLVNQRQAGIEPFVRHSQRLCGRSRRCGRRWCALLRHHRCGNLRNQNNNDQYVVNKSLKRCFTHVFLRGLPR